MVHVAAFHATIVREFLDVYLDIMEHQHASQICVWAGALKWEMKITKT